MAGILGRDPEDLVGGEGVGCGGCVPVPPEKRYEGLEGKG